MGHILREDDRYLHKTCYFSPISPDSLIDQFLVPFFGDGVAVCPPSLHQFADDLFGPVRMAPHKVFPYKISIRGECLFGLIIHIHDYTLCVTNCYSAVNLFRPIWNLCFYCHISSIEVQCQELAFRANSNSAFGKWQYPDGFLSR